VFVSFAKFGKWSPTDVVFLPSSPSPMKGMSVSGFLALCNAAELNKNQRVTPKTLKAIFFSHSNFVSPYLQTPSLGNETVVVTCDHYFMPPNLFFSIYLSIGLCKLGSWRLSTSLAAQQILFNICNAERGVNSTAGN
jgi:hypothetical protein